MLTCKSTLQKQETPNSILISRHMTPPKIAPNLRYTIRLTSLKTSNTFPTHIQGVGGHRKRDNKREDKENLELLQICKLTTPKANWKSPGVTACFKNINTLALNGLKQSAVQLWQGHSHTFNFLVLHHVYVTLAICLASMSCLDDDAPPHSKFFGRLDNFSK